MARRFNKLANLAKRQKRAGNSSSRKKRQVLAKISKAQSYVLNLSNHSLTESETLLLSKGLKYIPTPKTKNVKNKVMKDFLEFARKLKCKYHFSTDENERLHPFRENTGYKPSYTCQALENYIDLTQLEVSSIQIKSNVSNISPSERRAMYDLLNNKNIVIKKADKSNTVVIMNKQQYIEEGLRQLSTQYYTEIEKPNLSIIYKPIENKLNEMFQKRKLDKQTFSYLTKTNDQNIRPGRLYLLPKVHKMRENDKTFPKGRPIISQIGSPTERISHYVDYFLLPIVQSQKTYIKDTKDFINKIESIKPPKNCLLVTYDVTSMYTNMTFNELSTAVEEALSNFDCSMHSDIPCPETADLMFLLKCILENTIFEFNGKYYKQTIGCPMGSPSSPEISDIRMYQITEMLVNNSEYKQKICFHGRFRDDGFMIYDGSENEIKRFFETANECHPLLKFTYELSEVSLPFLDTCVYKGTRFQDYHILDVKSYIKPTNTFQYLHRHSAHPKSVFKGFIKGECIRHVRNTSDKTQLQEELAEFRSHLLKREYKKIEIDPIINDSLALNRVITLQETKKTKEIPNVLITKYDPRIKGLKSKLLKYWSLILKDETCKQIFQTKPMIAYAKHKSIGDLLTNAILPQ